MASRANKRTRLSQPAASSSEPAIEAKHAAFTTWAKDRGVDIGAVKPAKLPGRGLGLVTTSKIKSGKRILFVPEKAMFKPNIKFLKQHQLDQASPQAQLAVSLMAKCKERDSPLSLWEATWPTDSDFEHSLPMRWPASLRELLPPPIEQPLKRQEEDYSKDLTAAQGYLDDADFSTGDFRYYWSIVNSRSFHWKPPKGKGGFMAMCPFIDYMNHGPSGTTCDVFQRPEGYEVVANRDYEAGEEVLATYGAHSNDKLLIHYGFVLPAISKTPNHDDDIRLDHILLPKLSDEVRSQLQDVGFLGGYALLPATNELCFKTQVAVRAMQLTSNEWEYFVTNGEDLAEDCSQAVNRFMQTLLDEYRAEVVLKLEAIKHQQSSLDAEANEPRILIERWTQIKDAIDAFNDT